MQMREEESAPAEVPAKVPGREQVALDPGPVGRDPGIHPRESGLSASPAEAHHRCLHPAPAPQLTDQGAPGVALKETGMTNRGSGALVWEAGVGALRLRLTSGSTWERVGCWRQGEVPLGLQVAGVVALPFHLGAVPPCSLLSALGAFFCCF